MIILILVAFLFILFTFLTILTFSRGFLTAIYLTFIFFDMFFRMPFKAIQSMHNDREKIIKNLAKSDKLSNEHKEYITYILQKRSRLFVSLYKAGEFSYSELMVSLGTWYKNQPFKVRVNFSKQKRKSYESKYINSLKKDITGLEIISQFN